MGRGSLGGFFLFRRTWTDKHAVPYPQRLVGLASLSAQQVTAHLHKLKNTPGLGSNPGFQIVRRPCYHGATARPSKSELIIQMNSSFYRQNHFPGTPD